MSVVLHLGETRMVQASAHMLTCRKEVAGAVMRFLMQNHTISLQSRPSIFPALAGISWAAAARDYLQNSKH